MEESENIAKSLFEQFGLQRIDSRYATQKNLESVLKGFFCTESGVSYDFEGIKELCGAMKDDVSFIVEYPYTDAHYRSSFYIYYAAKYAAYERDTARVHIFSKRLTDKADIAYLGFFIVRPLKKYPLGHSFINPAAFKDCNFISCSCELKVHFRDKSFTVEGFPHVAQDTETHSCAESSVWALLSYFGLKYPEYRTFLPSEILQNLSPNSKDRLLPSTGLTTDEIATCLNASGQDCILDYVHENVKSTKTPSAQEEDFALMRIYIESGMPFVIALSDKKGIGHAVLAIGHENVDEKDVAAFFRKSPRVWNDISFFDKKLVFIDDNYPPYQIDRCATPVTRYIRDKDKIGQDWSDVRIRSFIVPLQKHMFLDAERAYKLVEIIFNNKKFGLASFGKKWLTRLLLTKSSSFKQSLASDVQEEAFRLLLKDLHMPKFIWICELYALDDYENKTARGLLILDSHGDDTVGSIIFYVIDDIFIKNNGLTLSGTDTFTRKFQKTMYRHNLKAWQGEHK